MAHVNGTENGPYDVFSCPPLQLGDQKRALKVEATLSPLRLSTSTLRKVAKVFTEEIERGLKKESSSLQMENTFLPDVPNGSEEGLYLALDLGGTNFRVLLLELQKGELVREEVKHYLVSDEMRLSTGEALFDFLAECVADFVRSEGLEGTPLPLGFTFSFPMMQYSLASGGLVTWTKSFKCSGMEDKDVVEMLKTSLHKCGMDNVNIIALLNDTTGTLVAGAKIDRRTGIGVIMGTGSNGCYIERADRVFRHPRFPIGQRTSSGSIIPSSPLGEVIVDVEWGAFGDNGCLDFIKTDIDRIVDQESLLVHSFTFEKHIGGKYLGSVTRITLADLRKKGLFEPFIPKSSLSTTLVSNIESDAVANSTTETLEILRRICGDGVPITEDDALVVQHVCRTVTNRAAQLLSVCIATLLTRMERDHTSVAVDGSVFKHHPRIKHSVDKYIKLLAPGRKFEILLAEDGSGKGAALTAAVAKRLMDRAKLRNPAGQSDKMSHT